MKEEEVYSEIKEESHKEVYWDLSHVGYTPVIFLKQNIMQ